MPYIEIDPLTPGLGHEAQYYLERDCIIDCRGPLSISPLSHWGIGVRVITASHDITAFGAVVLRPIVVKPYAWIGSYAVLYNCEIGEGAIVAIGSVVRSMNVPPWVMVEGNPAQVIAFKAGEVWKRIRR